MFTSIEKLDWNKTNGLIPAIIQDADSNQVLMLGYMNQEAFQKTIQSKKVTFFSRSHNSLWTKGETSGNFLELIDIQTDCDQDALLINAKPQGPTCHTGQISCFTSEPLNNDSTLSSLYALLEDRKKNLPKDSYTADLFKEGTNKICTKIAEESGEVIKAATKETTQRLTEESVDLIYHLLVLLVKKEISWKDLIKEIRNRKN